MLFSKNLLFPIAASAFLLPTNQTFAKRLPEDKPNVIFIYADDMGKGMLSAYGQKYIKTPNIDKIVNQGVSYSNAYGCMLSAPARASLLTGYSDCKNGKWKITGGGQFIKTNGDEASVAKVEANIDKSDVRLPNGDLYLAQVFKNAGYKTATVGKLEWGFTATRKQMKDHGWDYYYGYLDHIRCHGFYPPFLFDNGEIVKIPGNTHQNCAKTREGETPEKLKERRDMTGKALYSQEIFIEKIQKYIAENKDVPFFLFHPTQLPHGPVMIPKIHPEIDAMTDLTPIEKEYASMIKMMDDHVGIIFNELKKQGIEENTIIVFSADNGHEIYTTQPNRTGKYRDFKNKRGFDDLEHKYYSDLNGDIFNGNMGMAGLKRSNLEGGVHIPLAFYWKGKLAPKVCDELVSNYDFLPTMAELVNIKSFGNKTGISYLKTLFSNEKLPQDRVVFFNSDNNGYAIVENSGWKLRYYKNKKTWELFNVRKDLQERHNLIAENPQKAEELKNRLIKLSDKVFK